LQAAVAQVRSAPGVTPPSHPPIIWCP